MPLRVNEGRREEPPTARGDPSGRVKETAGKDLDVKKGARAGKLAMSGQDSEALGMMRRVGACWGERKRRGNRTAERVECDTENWRSRKGRV